jgi:hypothetical protein
MLSIAKSGGLKDVSIGLLIADGIDVAKSVDVVSFCRAASLDFDLSSNKRLQVQSMGYSVCGVPNARHDKSIQALLY